MRSFSPAAAEPRPDSSIRNRRRGRMRKIRYRINGGGVTFAISTRRRQVWRRGRRDQSLRVRVRVGVGVRDPRARCCSRTQPPIRTREPLLLSSPAGSQDENCRIRLDAHGEWEDTTVCERDPSQGRHAPCLSGLAQLIRVVSRHASGRRVGRDDDHLFRPFRFANRASSDL